MRRFWHPQDASAHAENQVAILGVPLIHRSHVIGVLYASNRTPGTFSREAISTLSSFAALAAIAINQAQLLQDKEQTLVRLHAVNDDLETRTREIERAVEAHDRLMNIVLRGGGVKEVVSVLAEYTAHYNTHRPHRALQLRPPRPQSPVPEPVYGKIRRRPVLGGLINQYEPAA